MKEACSYNVEAFLGEEGERKKNPGSLCWFISHDFGFVMVRPCPCLHRVGANSACLRTGNLL